MRFLRSCGVGVLVWMDDSRSGEGLIQRTKRWKQTVLLCRRNQRSPAYRVMSDAEFVLRFFTLVEKWQKFSGNYREEMNEYMERHRHPSSPQLLRMRSQFESVMNTCEGIW